ncbi:MAG: N-acetyltransferase [Chloroflexi bacterium]|nr:N-acetyltransferase [Chloroflexota bacterium]
MAVALEVEVRPLRSGDAEQVVDLLCEAFAGELDGDVSQPRAMLRFLRAEGRMQRGILGRLATLVGGEFGFFVAVHRDRVVGCAGVMGRNPPVISSVAVHAGYRGRGIARQLMLQAERFAAERGNDRVILDVLEGNEPALHLYDGLGYREFHRFRTYKLDFAVPHRSVIALPSPYALDRPRSALATAFGAIERASLPVVARSIVPTPRARYLAGPPSPLTRLMGGRLSFRRVLVCQGRTAGYLAFSLPDENGEGRIDYPVVPPEHTAALPAALLDGCCTLARAGGRSARVLLSDERPDQHEAVEAAGWNHRWTYYQLVKHLSREC